MAPKKRPAKELPDRPHLPKRQRRQTTSSNRSAGKGAKAATPQARDENVQAPAVDAPMQDAHAAAPGGGAQFDILSFMHPTNDGYYARPLPSSEEAANQSMALRPTAVFLDSSGNTTGRGYNNWYKLRLTAKQREQNKYWDDANKVNSVDTKWTRESSVRPQPQPISGLWDNLPLEVQPDIVSSSDNTTGQPPNQLESFFEFRNYMQRSRMQLEKAYSDMPETTEDECEIKSLIWAELDLKFKPFPKDDFGNDVKPGYFTSGVDFSAPFCDKVGKRKKDDSVDDDEEEENDVNSPKGRGKKRPKK